MPVAIVTGGNSGIGRATAVCLARSGLDVGIVWHAEEERAREAVVECEDEGVRAVARHADLEQVPGADAVVDELADELGGLDVLVNYCAAKHGLGGLTKVMALELAEHGITVNSVAPGEIATRMTGAEDEDPHDEQRDGIPAGRPGDAREVGAVISFLASADASYVTGQSYTVDGGMLLMAAAANQLA
jgi:NAD(P)-dependent dehydrogenase (short-subunit alcohol dehydrogenase family)